MPYASSQKASKALFSLAFAGLTLASVWAAEAADGLFLPTAPHESGGEDSISTPSGVSCRQSLNRGGAIVDLGIGRIDGSARDLNDLLSARSNEDTTIAYARLIIPLGKRPQRIDCSQIYMLEIERLKREIELLDASIE